MRILIINDRLICGGTEIYALNLKKLLSKDNIVELLCFDDEFEKNKKKIENFQNIANIKVRRSIFSKLNKIIFNPILYYKIKKKINKFKPDTILLNNIFYSPITQIKALKGYEVYQIVHDYSIVCPKSTCIKENFDICKGYKFNNCVKECTYNKSKISIFFKLYLTQRNEKLRKKYIKKFITPSECLNKYLIDNEYNSICINNPIDLFMTKIEVPKEKLTNRKLIYVGTINENKGILKFLETFIEFSKNNSFEIELFGKISTDNDEEKLNQIISQSQKVKYSGMLSNNDVIQKVQKAYAIVVPSAWMENYPTTVLEAQSNKTLVIGSNRGGIPEMLQDGKGYVFDINSKESIIETLEKIDRLSEESYLEMVNKAYNFVIKNNAYDTYLKKISNVILNTEK